MKKATPSSLKKVPRQPSNAPTLEELMRRLEKLMTENKKLRAKANGKKTNGSSSSSEEKDSSFEEDVFKKKKKLDKGYKKDKKYTKKKPYGQEWNSSDESSESESDDLATIDIKGKASSSNSLFPKLSKHTCLMAKESKKKIKSKASSSPKYITSDEDTLSSDNYVSSDDDDSLPSELVKKPNAMIKDLIKQVGARDELLEQQEELLVQDRKINEELKKLLAHEKAKVEKLDQELAQSKETTCSLKSSIGALQGQHDVLLKTHQDLEVQFGAAWSSSSKTSSDPKALHDSTSKGCKRCCNIDINAPCSNVEKMFVETCEEAIGQENDYLKREFKKLELDVKKLKKQAKVQPPQDNRNNMVKKLEKGKTAPNIASQPPKKQVQNEKDEKVEYARSALLNARRPHIKNGIGYKNGDKHNSRVNTKGQEFIKFAKANIQQEKKQSIKTTNNVSYSCANVLMFLTCHIMILMLRMYL
jgi:hypothetical protein